MFFWPGQTRTSSSWCCVNPSWDLFFLNVLTSLTWTVRLFWERYCTHHWKHNPHILYPCYIIQIHHQKKTVRVQSPHDKNNIVNVGNHKSAWSLWLVGSNLLLWRTIIHLKTPYSKSPMRHCLHSHYNAVVIPSPLSLVLFKHARDPMGTKTTPLDTYWNRRFP